MAEKSSIFDLAKYKIGDILFWTAIRPLGMPPVSKVEDEYLRYCHPKTWYERLGLDHLWKFDGPLPRLHSIDFSIIMMILTSEVAIETFTIHCIERSSDTGEFYYANEHNEWMPESYLFDDPDGAHKERYRLKKMVEFWATHNMLELIPEEWNQ